MRIIGRLILCEMCDEIIDNSRPLVFFGPYEYLPNIEKYGRPETQIVNVMKVTNDCVKYKGIDKGNRIDVNLFVIDSALADRCFSSF